MIEVEDDKLDLAREIPNLAATRKAELVLPLDHVVAEGRREPLERQRLATNGDRHAPGRHHRLDAAIDHRLPVVAVERRRDELRTGLDSSGRHRETPEVD